MEKFTITSTQNNLVKYCAKLQNSRFRKEEEVILLDGHKTIQGLINDNCEFEYLFLKEESEFINYKNVKNLVIVNDSVLKKISTTATQSDVVGIIKEKKVDKNEFKNLNKILLIDGIKDAGNLGTIIRSAVAFSLDGIILFNDCVDLYNSKVIRATAQNMFKIPIIATKDINFIQELRKTHPLISTVVDCDNDFMNCKFEEKFILAFGSEANGISDEILNITDKKITLKMDKNVESLNLAVCASIAFALIKYNFSKK